MSYKLERQIDVVQSESLSLTSCGVCPSVLWNTTLYWPTQREGGVQLGRTSLDPRSEKRRSVGLGYDTTGSLVGRSLPNQNTHKQKHTGDTHIDRHSVGMDKIATWI